MMKLSILALCLTSIDCLPTFMKTSPGLEDIPKDDVDTYPFFKREAMVRLDYGTFVGRDIRKTRQYFGIPYAAPPIGDLRFERPQPPQKFYGIKEVFTHGNGCFQDPVAVPLFGLALNRSEDCLNLSIWAPEGHSAEDEPIPVMVWILPGGFTSGYVSNPLYSKVYSLTIDGGNIVRHSKEKVMVVSFNYRMGFFGWTASREFQDAGLLNMGMYDIIAAFEWVKKYIGKFGGDPNRVTAFGESAGGILVSLLLFINLGTQQLFDFAIIESGTSGYTIPKLAEYEEGYDIVFREVGCKRDSDLVNCMKKVPAEIFANNTLCAFAEAFPVLDGELFQYQPVEAVKRGYISRVPLLIGSTTNEGTFFATRGIKTEEDLAPNLKLVLPFLSYSEILTIISWYNTTKFSGSAFYQAAEMIGDRFFYCPTIDLAVGLANLNVPVYKYKFNQQPRLAKWIHFFFNRLGVFHFSEIPFIFPLRFLQMGHDERALSDTMVNAWVTFAKTGTPLLSSPDTNEQLDWPKYVVNQTPENPHRRMSVVLHAPVQNIWVENDVYKDEICLKWREIEITRGLHF